MQVSKLAMVLFAQISPINALPIAIRSLARSYSNVVGTPATDQRWSKQDVLTLVGVCVGVVTVIIGLVGVLVASPKTREWLCRPFDWFTQCVQPKLYHPETLPLRHRPSTIKNWKRKDHREVHRQLQDRYNELLKMRKGGY